jgi:hypothetical protein
MGDKKPAKRLGRILRLPRLSGWASAAVLALCFLLTAVLVPFVFRLPAWLELEIVLATWWLIWCVALTSLLYTGALVSHDHRAPSPRNWFSSGDAGWLDLGSGGFDVPGDESAIGCLLLLVVIILLPIIAWLLIEVALPFLAFFLYLLIRSMLAHVVNDRHGCQGRLGKALVWGVFWATLYVAPLMVIVWGIHRLAGPG